MSKSVKFKRGCSPYVTGDIATFDDKKAERLVEIGAAVYENQTKELKKRKKLSLGSNRQVTTD